MLQTYRTVFFELFLDIHAKGLIQKDVVEHKFTGDGRKGERDTPYYIHTRGCGREGNRFQQEGREG